jgi:hypothetical protein
MKLLASLVASGVYRVSKLSFLCGGLQKAYARLPLGKLCLHRPKFALLGRYEQTYNTYFSYSYGQS